MIESLRASIEALQEEDFSGSWGGWKTDIYLNPEDGTVYCFLDIGQGIPQESHNGIDKRILTVYPSAIAQSVYSWVVSIEDTLEAMLKEYLGSEFDGHNPIGRWSSKGIELLDYVRSQDTDTIASWWDAEDWFDPDDLKPLWIEGKTAEEIIDQHGCGDVFNGMVDRDEAIAWLDDRIEEWKKEPSGGGN
ncbi:hypothetical protein [Chroococcidiopsis sp.]|uniref:hypothetical protein n=1 Tax=Chroococcidiopsis sp. TaxID=3088168 RepID=UPI003F38561C